MPSSYVNIVILISLLFVNHDATHNLLSLCKGWGVCGFCLFNIFIFYFGVYLSDWFACNRAIAIKKCQGILDPWLMGLCSSTTMTSEILQKTQQHVDPNSNRSLRISPDVWMLTPIVIEAYGYLQMYGCWTRELENQGSHCLKQDQNYLIFWSHSIRLVFFILPNFCLKDKNKLSLTGHLFLYSSIHLIR